MCDTAPKTNGHRSWFAAENQDSRAPQLEAYFFIDELDEGDIAPRRSLEIDCARTTLPVHRPAEDRDHGSAGDRQSDDYGDARQRLTDDHHR